MPVSDNQDYEVGHFKRVYEHIIKPACKKAGFEPIRADDVQKSNIIVVDILHKIVHSEMALCDLSSKNPNVLYELGIRQAFDLPVTLIKDSSTPRIFDIQGFRDIVYNSSMRVDEVGVAIEQIAESILETYEQHNTKDNSIISLLGITKASIKEPISLSPEMSVMMEMLTTINEKVNRLEQATSFDSSKLSEYSKSESNSSSLESVIIDKFAIGKHTFKVGDVIYHVKFGKGKILNIARRGNNVISEIAFEGIGAKTLLVAFAKLSAKPFEA